MKVVQGKDRKPDVVEFSDLKIGDVFYYQWQEDAMRIKISDTSYFSIKRNEVNDYGVISGKEYIKVKAELKIWRG